MHIEMRQSLVVIQFKTYCFVFFSFLFFLRMLLFDSVSDYGEPKVKVDVADSDIILQY